MSVRSDDCLPQPARFSEWLELAYTAELTRICHVLKALECAQDESLREEWRGRVADARARAETLASMLAELGVEPVAETEPPNAGDCLLDAMELALRNGDLVAAESIARECVVLAEVRCAQAWRHVHQLTSSGNTLAA
ncbi:MAG TPA: hypothetical protein VFK08_06125 [Rhodanobacteraceae bacterium]|nr:hypothetical protein [Rhodanobacteraceae bacterium]